MDKNKDEDFNMGDSSLWDNSDKDFDSKDYYAGGDPISNRENVISDIFETNDRLERLKHRWRGDIEVNGIWVNKFKPMATDTFINKQISAAESVVDKINAVSKKNDKECKRILRDAVRAFLFDAVNEEQLSVEDMRTMAKSYEHTLELFLGLVEFGHGASVFGQGMAGVFAQRNKENNNKGGITEWIKGKMKN